MNSEADKTADLNARLAMTSVIASRVVALAHLGSGLAEEVVDVVERMHGTISRRPWPLGQVNGDLTTGISGIVYRGIRSGFAAATSGVGSLARTMMRFSGQQEGPAWIATRGILNGVFGDALEALNNPIAQNMILTDRRGDASSGTLVLFVHGLCMTELGWQRGEFSEFESWCREELGAQTAHLRYNSGRHISINGCEFSCLLEAIVRKESIRRLIIVGHSMGGLLTRSACHYGKGLDWTGCLTDVVMLGTPHRGAPLERLGNFANGLLKHSPYTRPLSHLGDLRSSGIKDLRFTNLVDEHWMGRDDDLARPGHKEDPPLESGVNYLLVAATRSEELPDPVWRGRDDLLVPVSSALGLSSKGEDVLGHGKLTRKVIADLDHMALMGNRMVLKQIREHLGSQ